MTETAQSNVIDPSPCIILFDSQLNDQPNLEKYGNHIRGFLQFAYMYRNGYSDDLEERLSPANFPLVIPKKLPQQTNKCDCGLFLLEYSKHFFTNPPSMVMPANEE